MTETRSNWVRLNVGGKTFQTTMDTLSRNPDSFLARLVNGELSSDKDETGAILIDRSYEHFDTILNYLRTGSVNFDRNDKAMKDLLNEADFYNIEPLVDEIQKAMSSANIRTEAIFLYMHYHTKQNDECEIVFSEKRNDYEVLGALRDKFNDLRGSDGRYRYSMPSLFGDIRIEIEVILRNFGFDEKSFDSNNRNSDGYNAKCWKFVRTVRK